MVNLTSLKPFIPGSPSGNSGPSWPKTFNDGLPLPGGGTIGSMPTEILRPLFHRLGIPDSHQLGRDTLCERYAALLHKIHNEAGNAAVEKYLEEHRG